MHLTCVFESLPQQEWDAEIKDLSEIFHCVFSQEICLIAWTMPTLNLIKIHWSSTFCPLGKKKPKQPVQEAWRNSRGVI